MKKSTILCVLGLCLALCSGCEWTSGGGVEYWDESGDWHDFSGSYRAAEGSYLVARFGTGADGVSSTNIVSDELLGTGDGEDTAFGGKLAHRPIAGSLNIEVGAVGGYVFWDEAGMSGTASLHVSPEDGSSGTINYDTGAWSLSFPAPLAEGALILASYTYLDETPISQPGNHGEPIYTFVVYQTGNKLQIVDNNGSTYEGSIGSVILSEGITTAQFSAYGVSQGYDVTIVGTMQAGRMHGTFIEAGGYEGNINGIRQ